MNKIEFGNCIDIMQKWIDDGVKVNTCVTSPPYYGLRDYGTGTWFGGDKNCNHYRDSHISEKTTTGHKDSVKHGGIASSIFKSVCKKCGAIRQDEQFGLEETPKQYIDNMVKVFRLVRELLTDDGTLWVNIGDSYSSGGRTSTTNQSLRKNTEYGVTRPPVVQNIKQKDLMGIPWMLAFALREDGWYLRQDIIWHKPNPMPESITDRCTKSHEYIFLLSKSPKFYYDADAIREPCVTKITKTPKQKKQSCLDPIFKDGKKIVFTRPNLPTQKVFVDFIRSKIKMKELFECTNLPLNTVSHWFRYDNSGFSFPTPEDWNIAKEYLDDWSKEFMEMDRNMTYIETHYPPQWRRQDEIKNNPLGRNKRDVWTVNVKPYKEAHFAVFPKELIEPCIKAGCPDGGIVLDPFMGSGTTAQVAVENNKKYLGCELNLEYEKLQQNRIPMI